MGASRIGSSKIGFDAARSLEFDSLEQLFVYALPTLSSICIGYATNDCVLQ